MNPDEYLTNYINKLYIKREVAEAIKPTMRQIQRRQLKEDMIYYIKKALGNVSILNVVLGLIVALQPVLLLKNIYVTPSFIDCVMNVSFCIGAIGFIIYRDNGDRSGI